MSGGRLVCVEPLLPPPFVDVTHATVTSARHRQDVDSGVLSRTSGQVPIDRILRALLTSPASRHRTQSFQAVRRATLGPSERARSPVRPAAQDSQTTKDNVAARAYERGSPCGRDGVDSFFSRRR